MDTYGKLMLHGWKEIASHLSRDERTVKRWEKQRNLPVRRTPGAGRANVYALVSELDQWLDLAPLPPPAAPPLPTALPPLATLELVTPPTAPPRRWLLPVALAGVVLATAAITLSVRTHRVRAGTPPPVRAYVSPVTGVDELTLRAVYFNEQRTPESLNLAQKNLTVALAKDPADAPAWSALAQNYILLREYSQMPYADAYAKARAASLRAIALDPQISEPHASLAFIEFFWDWDPPAAERDFRAAIALDPNSALAHHWYGSMLNHEGRYAEALAQLDIAQSLRPTSTAVLSNRALALGLGGHRAEGMALLGTVVAQDPQATAPHQRYLILCMLQPIDYPCLLQQNRALAEMIHDKQGVADWDAIAHAYHASGERAMWQRYLAMRRRQGNLTSVAQAQVILGDTDAAFATLDRAFELHDAALMGFPMDPLLYPLHHDPRFQALLARIGLPSIE